MTFLGTLMEKAAGISAGCVKPWKQASMGQKGAAQLLLEPPCSNPLPCRKAVCWILTSLNMKIG